MNRRVAALRRAEQIQQRGDPGEARLDLGFRPALVQKVLDLQQRGDLVGRRGDRHIWARRFEMRSTSSRATCWRLRILSTTSAGALATNASLSSLAVVCVSSF